MHHSTMLNVDLFRFGLKGTVGALKNFVASVGGSNVQLKLVQIFRQVATHLQWTLKFHKNYEKIIQWIAYNCRCKIPLFW